MIIKYYSAHGKPVSHDLGKEKILSWKITNELGYVSSGGSLVIKWVQNKEGCKDMEAGTGLYPPVADIINLEEVLKYLKKKC